MEIFLVKSILAIQISNSAIREISSPVLNVAKLQDSHASNRLIRTRDYLRIEQEEMAFPTRIRPFLYSGTLFEEGFRQNRQGGKFRKCEAFVQQLISCGDDRMTEFGRLTG